MAVTVSPTENAAVWGPAVVSVAILLSNLLAWALNPRSWAHRHLLSRVGVPQMLFVSNRREGVPKAATPQTYWCFDLLDPHHLVESPLLNTAGLLVLHAAVFLYWVAAVLVDVVVEYYGYGCTASWCWRRSGPYLEWMTFLTNWSLSILGISGLVAFLNTARYARRQRAACKQQQQQQQQGQQPGELELGAAPVQSPHQQTSSSEAAVTPTAAAGAAPAAAGAGGWVNVFHRGAPATDTLSGPATVRDQAAAPHQQQKQREAGGPAMQQQQQQQSSSVHGSSCCSSSCNCDTVVVVGPDAAGRSSRVHTEKWDWLSVTHCLLSEVATTAAFFVSFWFWVGLVAIAGEFFRANGGTLMAHAGNLVLALCVVLLTRLPLVSTHFQVLLWYACLYMIFLLAYGGGSGTWRYGLDVQKAKPAAALLLVPLIVFIFFCLWFLVARLREAFFSRLRRRQHAGRRAKQAQLQQHNADHTIGAAAAV